MIEVRRAQFDDIDAMIELGKQGHARSANAGYKFDEASAKLLGAACIADKGKCALIAFKDGVLVGVLLGHEQQYPYIKLKFATDIAFYATAPGAGTKLLQAFKRWAFDDRHVDQLLLGVTFGMDRAKGSAALYARQGFTQVGGMFMCNRAFTVGPKL